MKILERVTDFVKLRDVVHIDDMQFEFMTGRDTTDAIFIVRQLLRNTLQRSRIFGRHS